MTSVDSTSAGPPAPRSELIDHIRQLSTPLQPRPTAAAPRLAALPDVSGVLFDVYGTLLISAAGEIGTNAGVGERTTALQQALADAAIASPDPSGSSPATLLQRLQDEIERDHTAARAAGHEHPEVDIRAVWQRILAATPWAAIERFSVGYECRSNPVWPMPHAATVVAALQRAGPVGIVSNAQFFTPLMLEALMPETTFDHRLAVWSYRERLAKPDPALFARAARQMASIHGLAPAQLLFVGNDMRNDVWAAQQAGLRTALFAGDQRSLRLRRDDSRCRDLQPDLVLTDLRQLDQALR